MKGFARLHIWQWFFMVKKEYFIKIVSEMMLLDIIYVKSTLRIEEGNCTNFVIRYLSEMEGHKYFEKFSQMDEEFKKKYSSRNNQEIDLLFKNVGISGKK